MTAVFWLACAVVGVGLGILVGRLAAAFGEWLGARQADRRWAQFNAAMDRETR